MTLWCAMNVLVEDTDSDGAAIEDFYRAAFVEAVERQHHDLAGGQRHELLASATRGSPAARFLTTFEVSDEPAANRLEHRDLLTVTSAPPEWNDHVEMNWLLFYRQVAETGPSVAVPYAIYLVGVNPPPGLNDSELEEFNDFYTNVHMPEVAQRRRCLRAIRYEIEDESAPPGRRNPRFLAVYEVDERSAASRRHIGGPYATGPDVWRRHTTPWRLWYRRLPN
jgi:hypothetical protein